MSALPVAKVVALEASVDRDGRLQILAVSKALRDLGVMAGDTVLIQKASR